MTESQAPAEAHGDTDWQHLKQYGYAPGGYMIRCRDCGDTSIGVDKRALRCRPCAEEAYAKGQSQCTPAHAPANHQSIATALREQGECERTYELQDAFNRAAQIVERMGK